MRLAFTLALLCGAAALAQQPKDAPEAPEALPRYGIPPKLKAYPQETAKKALASALEAIEKPDATYLVAQLLDPGFVDLRVADRSKQFEAGAELELARLRDYQQANLEKFAAVDRLPTDRVRFKALVAEKSRDRGFKQLVRDVEDKLVNDPLAVKDLRKFYRDGTFADTETGAKVTHAEVKDRALYFRKIGDRWFLENRQDEAVTMPKDEKKEPEKKP